MSNGSGVIGKVPKTHFFAPNSEPGSHFWLSDTVSDSNLLYRFWLISKFLFVVCTLLQRRPSAAGLYYYPPSGPCTLTSSGYWVVYMIWKLQKLTLQWAILHAVRNSIRHSNLTTGRAIFSWRRSKVGQLFLDFSFMGYMSRYVAALSSLWPYHFLFSGAISHVCGSDFSLDKEFLVKQILPRKKFGWKIMFLLQRRRQVVAAATFLVWSGGVITKSNWNARACKA